MNFLHSGYLAHHKTLSAKHKNTYTINTFPGTPYFKIS